jgi:hypothetical protein
VTTPNNEPVASCGRNPGGARGGARPATENEAQVDLTVQILEVLAERPAEQSESQYSATLQHTTWTEPGLTPAESSPSNDPVFYNWDNELEHLY